MGADIFMTAARGSDARDAFNAAVQEAQYDHGHAGYTGTIAEKVGFKIIPLPYGREPYEYAEDLINESDRRIDDKWGPAGCLKLEDGKYLFFGWASC